MSCLVLTVDIQLTFIARATRYLVKAELDIRVTGVPDFHIQLQRGNLRVLDRVAQSIVVGDASSEHEPVLLAEEVRV